VYSSLSAAAVTVWFVEHVFGPNGTPSHNFPLPKQRLQHRINNIDSIKMIFTRVLYLTTLLSLMNAASSSSLREMQATTLGAAFLAVAKNYTATPNTGSSSGYFNAELEASAIGPLIAKIDPLCAKFAGTVDSQSQNGNETVTTSYSVSCRISQAKFDMLTDAVIAVFQDYTYSFSVSTYVDSYYIDPAINVAQKKALENLMVTANDIEDLMLVVSQWQQLIVYPSPAAASTITINLSEKYIYPEITDDLIV
jgi:hypothetical protein